MPTAFRRRLKKPGQPVRGRQVAVKVTKMVRPAQLKDQTKAAVVKLMRTMIGKEAENKSRGFILEQNVIHNSGITDADVVPIIGSIPEGTSSLTRLGDRIKPKALTVRGIISTNPDNNPNNKPMLVSVYILTAKDKKTNALLAAGAGMADLLKPNVGGTEQVPFDGTTTRSTFPVNTEKFRVYYQKKLLLAPGSVGAGTRQFECLRWSYSFGQLPASLTYDEATGDDANNFAPFLVIGYSYADGTVPEVINGRVISNAYAQLTFEDA